MFYCGLCESKGIVMSKMSQPNTTTFYNSKHNFGEHRKTFNDQQVFNLLKKYRELDYRITFIFQELIKYIHILFKSKTSIL